MPVSCVAVGCTNRWSKDCHKRFYLFPTEPQRQGAWLRALRRENFPPPSGLRSHHRVCSDHFVTGYKNDDPVHVDYTPSVFTYSRKRSSTAVARHERLKRRRLEQDQMHESQVQKTEQDSTERQLAAASLMSLSIEPPRIQDKSTSTDADPVIQQLLNENAALRQTVQTLKSRIAQLEQTETTTTRFGFDYIKQQLNRDIITCHYTGLLKFSLLEWLCDLLADKVPNYVTRLNGSDRVLLVLMKLKMATTNQDLAVRFGISVQAVSVIICSHISVMADVLKFLVPWPDRETINKHMPKQCRKNFPQCRIIIDCTEVFVERSKNLLARAQTYSHYKHHNTIKFLVGIAPSGAFTYISRCWGGRASDKQITIQDGLLDKLDHGDMVLADRGFLVTDELAVRGITLAMPAFTKGKQQLARQDVEKSRQMSRLRIHIERAIRRLKVYKIMSTRMPISLLRYADSMAVICAALCNLRGKLF